jgi:hypothetical protein
MHSAAPGVISPCRWTISCLSSRATRTAKSGRQFEIECTLLLSARYRGARSVLLRGGRADADPGAVRAGPTRPPQDGIDSANRRTIDSYERIARDYAEDTAPDSSGAAEFSGEGLRRLVDAVPAGRTALEVGSGPGWDADFVELQGVAVRRTEVTAAFIDFQADGASTSRSSMSSRAKTPRRATG